MEVHLTFCNRVSKVSRIDDDVIDDAAVCMAVAADAGVSWIDDDVIDDAAVCVAVAADAGV